MSDHWIIIIPADRHFVPTDEAQRLTLSLFTELAPTVDEVNAVVSETIRFIDCGGNFERILCPACRAEIDFGWWGDQMESEHAANFPLRPIRLPCCGALGNVGELIYEWPVGFARFSVEARNPGIGDLTADQLKIFENVLGCRVRKILQHI